VILWPSCDVTPPARRPPRRRLQLAGVLPVAAILLGPVAVRAQPAERDLKAADALFNEARELVKQGNYVMGCPKFEASLALVPSPSTTINIAKCHEHSGRIATAWEYYRRALELNLNRPTTDVDRQKALHDIATEGMNTLEPRLPKLRVNISNPPPSLDVLCDGKQLSAVSLGQELPLDPGRHEVRVSAPGYRAQTHTVLLAEGKTITVGVTLEAEAPAGKPNQPVLQGGGLPTWVGLVTAGVGVVGVGVGAVLGGLAIAKYDESNKGKHCFENNRCDPTGLGLRKDAIGLGNASTATIIVGGLVLAGGVTLFAVARSSGGKQAGAEVSLVPGGLTVRGRW
jgi:hypothetical protein